MNSKGFRAGVEGVGRRGPAPRPGPVQASWLTFVPRWLFAYKSCACLLNGHMPFPLGELPRSATGADRVEFRIGPPLRPSLASG